MDIIAMVLRAAKEGSTKTHIMYDAYLSYSQVREYIGFLTERELLRYDSASRHYSPTQRGEELLATYDGISDLIRVGGTRGAARAPEVSVRGSTPSG